MTGGLGNQIFQWAAGFALSKRLSIPMEILPDRLIAADQDFTNRNYELDYFSILPSRSGASVVDATGAKISHLLGLGMPPFEETSIAYDSRIQTISAGVTLKGYFQSWRYFSDCSSELTETLIRGATPTASFDRLSAELREKNWVGVHVRRGDYLRFPGVFALCGRDYYAAAIESLSLAGVDEIVVFSESLADAKSVVPQATRYVDANEVGEPGDVVMLLAAANCVVGANSSLSWWGAFLNDIPGERKIFPKSWFGPKGWSSEDIVPPQWTLC